GPQITALGLKDLNLDPMTAATLAIDCIEKIKLKNLKQKLNRLSIQIKEAEAQHQNEQVILLLKEKQNVLAHLANSSVSSK
ncbi:MAG: hypothetical protein JNK65_07950, partial [Deltaproteobacteria bacterium]|nr:hypothetical protein [Deltaproteobacteria bacterium]